MNPSRHPLSLITLILAFANPIPAIANAGGNTVELRFENRHFAPPRLAVPAGQPVVVRVINSSAETIEFESFKLNREKVVSPGQTITVNLPALSAGSYDFYDDFHQDVSEGTIVAE